MVAFDWNMPPMTGVDTDFDGVVNLSPPGNPPTPGSYIPTSWRVILDACASTPSASYQWTFTSPSLPSMQSNTCATPYDFPAQGSYHVTLTAQYGNTSRSVSHDVSVKNYLVVSVGDSVASGEGVPDVPWDPFTTGHRAPVWENASCHRSARSGPALAALALENSDPHSSVTFISEACSGAAIVNLPGVPAGNGGLLDPYMGQQPLPNGQTWIPQLSAVMRVLCPDANLPTTPDRDWVNPIKDQCRPIDALLVTAGANDVGFGLAAAACSLPDVDCSTYQIVTRDIANGLVALPTFLDTLNTSIKNQLNVGNVYFTEYHDPTHGSDGQLCPEITLPNLVSDAVHDIANGKGFFYRRLVDSTPLGLVGVDGDVTPSELSWLHDFLVAPMNQIVADASTRNNWIHIGGVANDFQTHGYCASDSWVVNYPQSRDDEGLADGTYHPNAAGHQAIAARIGRALLTNLPGGNRKDFNRDGHTDMLWYNGQTGQIGPWYMNNTTITDSPLLSWGAPASSGWAVKGTGDFNGDGQPDVVWYKGDTGDVSMWMLNGTQVLSSTGPSNQMPASNGWDLKATGDFDGDGHIDLLWQHQETGTVGIWFMKGTTFLRSEPVNATAGPGSNGWEIKSTGDFDGDGKPDILWYQADSGSVGVWFMDGDVPNGSAPLSETQDPGAGWQLKGTGDFDHDGDVDVLWHNPVTGEVKYWYMKGTTVIGKGTADWNIPGSSGWEIVSR
ncbi:MAG TPA: FG-GAP-like repeat-containing protein [Polyangia bacterium]|nr:FG-GAP-like repeat-containing protein [Polyangia bacterium]